MNANSEEAACAYVVAEPRVSEAAEAKRNETRTEANANCHLAVKFIVAQKINRMLFALDHEASR